MKRFSLASLFGPRADPRTAAVLNNAVTAVARGEVIKPTSRRIASSKRLGALVAQLR